MCYNRLGLMGNYYGGMLDIYSNLTLHCASFGGHIEIIEVDEWAYRFKDQKAGSVAEYGCCSGMLAGQALSPGAHFTLFPVTFA